MAAEDDGKSEAPTAKRKSEARNKGQVAKSADLNSGVVMLFGIFALWFFGRRYFDHLQLTMVSVFNQISTFELSEGSFFLMGKDLAKTFLFLIYPILLSMLVVGIVVNVIQVGFKFTTYPLKPKFDKVFSLKGLKRIFGKNGIVELLKGLAKMTIVGIVGYRVIKSHYEEMLFLADTDLVNMFEVILVIAFELAWKIALLLLIIGIIDFLWQRHKHNDGLKMTKQEVRDEQKMSEGDPKVKAKLRQVQREMAQKMMMSSVPDATVVVTNPTFLAIALKYEKGVDQAPMVVAKGKRLNAEKIRDNAKANDVPIVENKPLARSMYDVVEPGDVIPEEFFSAVAEVLAYVFSMEGQKANA